MKQEVFVSTVPAHSAEAASWFLLFFPFISFFFLPANVGTKTKHQPVSGIQDVFFLSLFINWIKTSAFASLVKFNFSVVTI